LIIDINYFKDYSQTENTLQIGHYERAVQKSVLNFPAFFGGRLSSMFVYVSQQRLSFLTMDSDNLQKFNLTFTSPRPELKWHNRKRKLEQPEDTLGTKNRRRFATKNCPECKICSDTVFEVSNY
jgi:hypothetical protein